MKICITGNTSWSIINFRKELISELCRNHAVYILTPDEHSKVNLEELGCIFIKNELSRKSINPIYELKSILEIRSIFSKYKFDYVLSFNVKPNLYALIGSIGLKIKIISNISGLGSTFLKRGLLGALIKFLYRAALRFAKHVFFQNSHDQAIFVQSKLVPHDKSSILPGSGVNLEIFKKDNKHLLNKDEVHFSFIGRLIRDKGLKEFLEAAQSIKDNNVIFHIFGDFDSHNPSSFKDSDLSPYASNKIIFHGKVQDIKEALRISHCIVLPSYREGMSRSLLEGAAFGLPLIASNVPGCQELIIQNKSGFLVEVQSKHSLEKAFNNFLDLSPKEMLDMGNASREHIERHFDVKKVIRKYLERII